jgi:outer membrane beta-barrel protein
MMRYPLLKLITHMKKLTSAPNAFTYGFMLLSLVVATQSFAANMIEEQLAEIGAVPDEEIVVVQRKYTRKNFRFELTPVAFGGVPFGTVRRTLFGGANATFHLNDWLGIEAPNFVYTKGFFSGFTSDINAGQDAALPSARPHINVSEQKLLFFLTGGLQFTPFYGKLANLSRFIAYIEPFFSVGAGIARTETSSYLTLYPGVGFRLFFKEWFSFRFDFRDYIYTERSTDPTSGSITNTLRNNYAFTVSLSFWLPKMPSN